MLRAAVPSARRGGLVLIAFVLAFVAAGAATAQAQSYSPAPPTKGALYTDGQANRYLLGGAWLYRPDLSDAGLTQGWWRDQAATTGWSPTTVPNSYNTGDFSTASQNGYVGWYRRDFTLPRAAFPKSAPARFQHWILRFDSVNYSADVWLNGYKLGSHAGAYLPFEFDMSHLRAGVNRLVVRVDNRRTKLDVPSGNGGWWNFGGLLGEVYLRAVTRVDVAQVQVRPILSCSRCAATIAAQADLRNLTRSRQTVRLKGAYGKTSVDFGSVTIAPLGTSVVRTSARIAHPRLWSIDHPTLYRATLTLRDSAGRRIGGYVTESGIRRITVTSDGRLALNGRLLDLRGVSMHEQNLVEGAALDPAHDRQLIGWVRSLGATIIRAHYPLNPELEELADRNGILLWSEIPVWRVSSQYLGQPAFLANAMKMLKDNILTNQNHPSVLLWSVGNELPPPDRTIAAYIKLAAATARALDPTRPVAMSGIDARCHTAYAPLSVVGWNEYFGYFAAGGGATDDRDALSGALDAVRACNQTRAVMVTEFGFDGNRTGPVEQRGTYAFESDSLAFHLAVMASKPWLSGAITWILQDFAAWPGWAGGNPLGTPPFVAKGLVDLNGNLKPAFAVVASIYHAVRQIGAAGSAGPGS